MSDASVRVASNASRRRRSDLESGLFILSLKKYYYCYGILGRIADLYMLGSQRMSSTLLGCTSTSLDGCRLTEYVGLET